jgi:3-hydroxy-9,10-secoandrosta-1,3,5(10)-triene-9,17-dione monooxygenase
MQLAYAAAAPAIPQPEPGLTAAELLTRASAFCPMLRERQAEHEAPGSYAEEVHEAFLAAGFYRITQPRMFGG